MLLLWQQIKLLLMPPSQHHKPAIAFASNVLVPLIYLICDHSSVAYIRPVLKCKVYDALFDGGISISIRRGH